MTRPHVLIGSPIRQKPYILKLFLDSLRCLKHDSCDISYFFIDDNIDKVSSSLLERFSKVTENVRLITVEEALKAIKAFQAEEESAYASSVDSLNSMCISESHQSEHVLEDREHDWREANVWKVAAMKNFMLATALEEKYSHVFLADSDLLFHPNTLEQLLQSKKEIVSTIYWTSWQEGTMQMPQVWVHGEYEHYPLQRQLQLENKAKILEMQRFFYKLRQPGLYEVGGLGACTLISSSAIKGGVSFKEITNLTYWGEDRHFSVRALALGFKLYVNTVYPAYHIYRDSDLEGALNYSNDVKESGISKATISEDSDGEAVHELYSRACELQNYGYDAVAFEQWNKLLNSGKGTTWQQIHAWLELDSYYSRHGEKDKGRLLLLDAVELFRYAELYCRLGTKCMDEHNWLEAASWYQAAIATLRPDDWESSPDITAWTWKPYIQLCVCYNEIGDLVRAFRANEQGLMLEPTHPTMNSNRQALLKMLNEAKMQKIKQ